MKAMRWVAPAIICLTFLFASVDATSAQTKVGLIDIGQVFKNHPQFSNKLKGLRDAAEAFRVETQQVQQAFNQKTGILEQYEKDSNEYRTKEAELAQESAKLEVDARNKMRSMLTEEAVLHFDTYVEVSDAISKYCMEQGIQLVLRYNSEQMDPKNPDSIMQRVNGSVVYHDESRDITLAIIQRIAQSGATAVRPTGTQNR